MQINHNNLKILKVSKDNAGKFLKLEVNLPDGAAIIRWGLDDLDFKRIRDIVSKNYFDSLQTEYHYELLPSVGISLDKPKGNQKFIGSVRCVQGDKAARIEFECSERFAGNMEWFRSDVGCLGDIKHLGWENFNL
jgi:hypothetical protein